MQEKLGNETILDKLIKQNLIKVESGSKFIESIE